MHSGQPTSQADLTPSDEVDLHDLIAKLWSRRWWVVATTAISVIFAVSYLVIVKPTFEAKAYLRPPLASSLGEVDFSGVVGLGVGEAFEHCSNSLVSRGVRYNFFDDLRGRSGFVGGETKLSDEQLFLGFDANLDASDFFDEKGKKSKSDTRVLRFQHTDKEYAVTVVNGMIDKANDQSVQNFRKEFEAKLKIRLLNLEGSMSQLLESAAYERSKKIVELEEQNLLALQNAEDRLEVLRKKAKQKRYDRVEQLKEAISVAKELNLVKPTTISALAQSVRGSSSQMVINTGISQRIEPLYLRGVELLNVELGSLIKRSSDDFTDPAIRELEGEIELLRKNREVEVLRSRQNDELFIMEQLSPLKGEIKRLKSLDIDFSAIEFCRVDRPATVAKTPIKPKRGLIIALSLVFGVVCGLFVSLIAIGIDKWKAI